MKRFTETTKWDNPWFRKLKPKHKLLWAYFLDKCDAAGVADLDFELASFQIGESISEKDVEAIGPNLQKLPNGKLWAPKFIRFQYSELSKECKAHWPVYKLIESHGLDLDRVLIGYQMVSDSPQEKEKDKEKDKDKEKEGECEGKLSRFNSDCKTVLDHFNQKTGRSCRHNETNYAVIHARLSEAGVDCAGVLQMIDRQCAKWKNDPKMADYLRVETLFRKSNFESYYSAKDMPVDGVLKTSGLAGWEGDEWKKSL